MGQYGPVIAVAGGALLLVPLLPLSSAPTPTRPEDSLNVT